MVYAMEKSMQTELAVQADSGMQQAILAGGCFWCTEAVLKDVHGVVCVESGYIGGYTPNPDYKSVCSGMTGHAEAVRVTFDPRQVSFKDLLGLFFATHDPTSLNRQGADVGTQYRSAVFVLSEVQAQQTRQMIDELSRRGIFDAPIVTSIEEATTFYVAEDNHQDYYARHPHEAYCRAVIGPKIAKLRREYSSLLRNS